MRIPFKPMLCPISSMPLNQIIEHTRCFVSLFGRTPSLDFKPLAVFSLLFMAYMNQAFAQTCVSTIEPNNPDSEFTIHNDGTVSHSDTGLMWDRCTWGQTGANCDSGSVSTYTWEDAQQQATIANQQAYKGYSDWRLPTKRELQSLVEYQCYEPAINTVAFPAMPSTPLASFWSGSLHANSSDYAWIMYFNYGYVSDGYLNYETYYVQLVRGGRSFSPLPNQASQSCNAGAAALDAEFDIHTDGTTTHARTGLIWDRCAWGQMGADCAMGSADKYTWDQAQQQAQLANQQNYKGYSDWRLPTIEELVTFAEEMCIVPTINTTAFPATPSNYFWSDSPHASSSGNVWGVHFGNGDDYANLPGNASHVRLVRGGQSFGPLPAVPIALFEVSSSDLSLTVTANIVEGNASYAWEMVHKYDPNDRYTGAGQSTSFQVSSAGEYDITLTVANRAGNDTLTQSVTLIEAAKLFSLSLTQIGEGAVSGSGDFAAGANVTLSATPAVGHGFAGWSPAPCANSFVMPANELSCTATFSPPAPQAFSLTLMQTGDGTISGAGDFIAGAPVTLTATPAVGHGFAGWSPTPCANSFVMPSNALSCTATFSPPAPQDFSLTLTQTGEGTVSGAGDFAVGNYVNLSATPATGYRFADWSPAPCQESFAMPASDLACLATFELISTSGLGKAIIITASGSHKENTLFSRSEELTRNMYRTLYQRGFEHEDIIWLNPKTWQDINGNGADDGVVDNDLFDPEAALNQAFDTMRNLQAGQQFVLHIHGHALQDQLKITRDYWLPATQLKTLLDKVPTGVQQIVIVDTCYSGSFLDELQGHPDRIVLTASDAQSTAWNAKYATFSGKLIETLRRGGHVGEAFQATENMMRDTPKVFGAQRPQLDDNGDGVFSSQDGTRAAQVVIGKDGLRAADAPEIVRVHERLSLSSAEAVLWVKTSPTGEQVRKVRATLIPPTFAADHYAGEDTDFGRIELDMGYNSVQARFEAVQPFNQAGLWKVLYQAQGLDGTWSEQVNGEVQLATLKAVSIQAVLNQSIYRVGEQLRFDVQLNALDDTTYDVYAAIIFPAGYFVTLRYPLEFSLPGTIIPYQSELSFNPSKHLNMMDLALPPGLQPGTYSVCGALSPAGNDPWDMAAWVDFHCADFDLK